VKHDIPRVINQARAQFPSGKPETAREVLVLLEATRQAKGRSHRRISRLQTKSFFGDTPELQRKELLRELAGLDGRLALHAQALGKLKPTDPPPASLDPFLHNITWPKGTPPSLRHSTPDFATPFMVDNQAGELDRFGSFQTKTFLRYLKQSADELDKAAKKAAKAAGQAAADPAESAADIVESATGSVWPWALGIGVVGTLTAVAAIKFYPRP